MLRTDHLDVIKPALEAATGGEATISNDGRVHGLDMEYRIDQKKGQIRLYGGDNETIPEALIGTCSVNVAAITKMLRKAKIVGVAA